MTMETAVRSAACAPSSEQASLAAQVRGPVLLPGLDDYDTERRGFNTLLDHRPRVIVGATGTQDVVAAVRFATARGLPVGVQATGHGPAVSADDAVLISTRRMTGLRVDPRRRTARIEAGVCWEQVIHEAAAFGLAPLNGSSPLVGAVSYTLGGGLGVMARTFGYAADHVRGIDVVTADGVPRQLDTEHEPDLFWALRGGKGNFGVVTSIELGLVPVTRLYGGTLSFAGESAPEVLRWWLMWTADVPEEMNSSIALVRLPDDPGIREELRGRFLTQIRIAFTGPADQGESLVAPLRGLAPRVLDTVAEMPYTDVASIHADPTRPYSYHERTTMLRGVDQHAIDALLAVAGPGTDCRLGLVELRHLGGALRRAPAEGNAVGNREADFCLLTVAPGGPRMGRREADDLLLEQMSPWSTGGRYLNFLDASATPDQVRAAYSPDAYARLAELKAEYDPGNVFRLNHNIPPSRRRAVAR
ncbi:FAD-binding oxidoreductase [Microbispora siamensis]|uniref:Oxidoreductase n=1 Tax=Microbispora siamensis TaxID=564413 RepID=A0ABQ4GJR9_9ACTN|nr:FAD-binding oxidoreductase [Microbispora siamensis]GIH61673.1 oxidoreductase [Microbispora siamensis]